MEEKTYEQIGEDFKWLYFQEIKPCLAEYEKKRKEKAPTILAMKIFLTSFLSIFIIGFTPDFIFISGIKTFLLSLAIPATLISIIFMICNNKVGQNEIILIGASEHDIKLKEVLMKKFLGLFSSNATWQKYETRSYWEKIKQYRSLKIFNPFLLASFDDTITLTHKNISITMCEINTSLLNAGAIFCIAFALIFIIPLFPFFLILTITVFFALLPLLILSFIILLIVTIIKAMRYAPFKGVIVELDMNKNFKGHTFFLNRSVNSKKIKINRGVYENIELESVDFMEKYEVFSTDQIEARYLLTTGLIERIENIKLSFNSNYIRGAFKDNKLYIAIDTGRDMFAMGNDFKKSDFETFRTLFQEIISLMKLIEQFNLDSKSGL